MTPRGRRLLWGMIGLGVLGRIVVAFATYGSEYDVESWTLVAARLTVAPLDVFGRLPGETGDFVRWPYPPGYFPWLLAARELADLTPVPFHGLVAIPAIAADAGIAWLVQDHLRHTGATERTRLAAVALVALGPSFAVTSGYHGAFDSVAFLPAVLAVSLWERRPDRRALVCGLLIGTGALVKTVPAALLLVLLPRCTGRREAVTLVLATAALPLAFLAPWLADDPGTVITALGYVGVPGSGGMTLALHPAGADAFIGGQPVPFNESLVWVVEHRFALSLALAAGVGLLLAVARPPAVAGAVLLMLALYAFGTGFFLQYLVWGLPFLVMAGHLRVAAAVQALALVPALLFYGVPWSADAAVTVYVTSMIVLWAGFLAALTVLSGQALSARPGSRSGG